MKTSTAFLFAAILSFLVFISSLLNFFLDTQNTHRGLTLTSGLISLVLALYLGVRFYDGRAR